MMEPIDDVHFEKSDWHSSCFSAMRDMRENEELCDITIKIGHESLAAHRIILASAIPYFKAMFSCNMEESRKNEITMYSIDPVALKCLIDFAYTSKLTIDSVNAVSLLETSMYLQLDCVIEACLHFLSNRMCSDNVFMIRECASSINDVHIVDNADVYIRENFQDVSMSQGFSNLPLCVLKDLIHRDDISVVSEEVVFKSVMSWVKASELDRAVHLPELLRHIRLPLLRPSYLVNHVLTEELILTSDICWNMVEEVRNYHFLGKGRDRATTSSYGMVRARWGRERHHLKCAALMGYGIYSVCQTTGYPITINYYDPVNMGWMPLGVHNQSLYPHYVVGTEENIIFIQNQVVRLLNLASLQWTHVKTTFERRINAAVTLHCNKVYFLGGDSQHILCLDPLTGTCVQEGKIKTLRTHPGAVSLAESIYVIGGLNSKGSCLRTVEKYDPVTKQTGKVSSMRSQRVNFGCAALDGKIFVCGGANNKRVTPVINICEVYDPLSDQWNLISTMNRAMCPSSLFSYSGQLYAIDADSRDEKNFYFEIYDPNDRHWKQGETLISFKDQQSMNIVFMNPREISETNSVSFQVTEASHHDYIELSDDD